MNSEKGRRERDGIQKGDVCIVKKEGERERWYTKRGCVNSEKEGGLEGKREKKRWYTKRGCVNSEKGRRERDGIQKGDVCIVKKEGERERWYTKRGCVNSEKEGGVRRTEREKEMVYKKGMCE